MNTETNTLITGASGLLGSQISIINSLKPSSKALNLLNYEELNSYIIRYNIRKIINCAAMVGGIHANHTKMYDFFSNNLTMNMNVLRACKEHRLETSIFILSTCILPANAKLPYVEDVLHDGEPHFTNYGYAYAKRMMEVGSRSLKEQHGISTYCLIPCNLYGPKDNYNLMDGHVIPSLIHKCYLAKQNNEDFVVWGSGEPEREFIYADDLAQIIELMHNSNEDFPSKMIVSSSQAYKIKDIVELIAQKLNFTGNIVFDTSKPDGIFKKPTDSGLFKKYFPKFQWRNMEQGLDITIQYFLRNYPNVRV